MDVDLYKVKIRFPRLFPDPAIFDEPANIAQRYLSSTGVSPEKTGFIHQSSDEAEPLDDSGKPSVVSGEANYRYQGKTVRSEYMAAANIAVNYVDFGSGMLPAEHKSRWNKGRWGELFFELKDLQHERRKLELPDIGGLYQVLVAGGLQPTLATIELKQVPQGLVGATARFIDSRLGELAKQNGQSVEVYESDQLGAGEKEALSRRLARQIEPGSLLVILAKQPMAEGSSPGV